MIRPSGGERTAVITPNPSSSEQTDTGPPPVAALAAATGVESTATDRRPAGRTPAGDAASPDLLGRLPLAWRETLARPWLWLLAAVVVVLLVVVVVVVLTSGDDGHDTANGPATRTSAPAATSAAAAPPAASAAAPTTPAPGDGSSGGAAATPQQATPAAPVIPAGWHLHSDPTGFSLAVPDGWNVSREGSIVYFRDPSEGRILSVDQTNQPHRDPVADWTRQEGERAGSFYPGYQRIRIAPVDYFVACADWEFTYDQRGTRAHVINRGVVTSDHQAYGIWWSTPESTWQANLPNFELIMKTFTPKP
ncbi:hypothetical protein ACNTMW_16040 [Planosporangium sp. 12N6]|uniref:hypothetical protein n=1 Tax=Planosporangium spinosum TaxID=3402278 RepID=UPI003CEB2A07